MADQTVKLKLDTREFDAGMRRVQGGFGNLTTVIAGAAAAFGGFQVAKGFLQTARSIENLKFQLAALTGSTTEAAKAMSILQDFAGGVPFELGEIQKAAPSLLAVTKNTEELNELLAITGDIAAASGLDFQTVALQLQRTFSAGIGAADLFRDRAVKSMLGFQEGVQYTAAQSRDLIVNGFRDGTIAIAGESSKMASTFDGVMSMISDKYLQFQIALMDSGPFEAIKAAATLVEEQLSKNFGSIKEAGQAIGAGIVDSMAEILIFSAKVMDGMKPLFDFIGNSVANIVNFAEGLPGYIKALGIIGFLALGVKGKLIVVAIGAVVDEIMMIFAGMTNFLASMKERTASMLDFLGLDDQAKAMRENAKELRAEADAISDKYGDLAKGSDELSEAVENNQIVYEGLGISIAQGTENMGENEKAIRKILKAMDDQIKKTKELEQVTADDGFGQKKTSTAPVVDKKQQEKLKKQQDALAKQFEALNQSLMSETERENFEYNNKLAILDKYYDGRQHLDTEYARLRETLEQKHQKKLGAIADANARQQIDIFKSGQFQQLDLAKLTEDQKVQFAMDAGRNVLSELGKQNKAAFEASKALNIAQAIMNTAAGATKALAQGGVFGPLLAGLVIAAGAVQIAAISSQKYQGRQSGGLVQKGTPYVVGEAGSEMFVPNQTGTIVPNRNMGGNAQNVNVTFNINAVDARGVDELLVERKGLITGIIRDAANQKGERSPV